jgi:hypothetical protein
MAKDTLNRWRELFYIPDLVFDWCHVLRNMSFTNAETALLQLLQLMNRRLPPILVVCAKTVFPLLKAESEFTLSLGYAEYHFLAVEKWIIRQMSIDVILQLLRGTPYYQERPAVLGQDSKPKPKVIGTTEV